MQRESKLYLSICDFNKNVVCDLYDNQSDISGQATNVFITKERNGWKELTFDIPSTCFSENGEIPNYRLDYLVAEYRIRAIDDEVDWYVISEPQIKRNAFSKNVSVKAGHISQTLKHKNLDLEFSDDEGNNVGTADKLLETILEGTGWQPGYVETFLEDNGNVKARTITAQAGTGALALIDKLCDVFEAKPIYHGDSKTVDIIAMNPFAKIDPENIPRKLLEDENSKIIELYYDKNIHSLTKTSNTENMATRLYAYGSYGDMNGECSLVSATHNEWTFTCPAIKDEYSFAVGENIFFFTGNLSVGDVLVWSDLDITSMTYIYNNNTQIAYRVSKTPSTGNYQPLVQANVEEKQNYFAFLLALKYYDDVGLMSEEQFQEVARYQRETPALLQEIITKNEAFVNSEATLEDLASHGNGLLRLNIDSYSNKQFVIDVSDNNGVMWRTDFTSAERRYFMWHVTDKLNEYGDPVKGNPSMILVIHKTNPVTFEMAYLKEIWDKNGMPVVNSEGEPIDFSYDNGDYPSKFSVWTDIAWASTDEVYLFCTNSITGKLGGKLSCAEGIERTLYENTAMYHSVTFVESAPYPAPIDTEYQWQYRFNRSGKGELYFSWKDKYISDTGIWRRVYEGTSYPPVSTISYFYNTKTKTLYRWETQAWKKIEDKQTIVAMFDSVIDQCHEYDKQYQGLYEYYTRNGSLSIGNYAIYDDFNAYWLFKLKENVSDNILLDTTDQSAYIYSNITWDGDKPIYTDVVSTTKSIPEETLEYPVENMLEGVALYPGTLSPTTGLEETDATYRTGFVDAKSSTVYTYHLPQNTTVFEYNSNKNFIKRTSLSNEDGSFTTTNSTKYIKFLVYELNTTYYFRTTENDLLENRPFVVGNIDANGNDKDINGYRTYSVNARQATVYQYSFAFNEAVSISVYEYDINYNFIRAAVLMASASSTSGTFTTATNTSLLRFTCTEDNFGQSFYVHEVDYDKKVYYAADGQNKEAYYILSKINTRGELVGIYNLINRFSEVSNLTYNVYLKDFQEAQQEEKDETNRLAALLDDMLKDGRWRDTNYAKYDVKRLYDDSMYMLRQISVPETSYSFTYLDLKDSKLKICTCNIQDKEYPWPDIDIVFVAHLVDMESKTNCWAYIDKIKKCYDQSWKTEIEIDTKLTLAARHGFTDVIARIAEVAKEINTKQSLYDQALKNDIDGSRLQGVIDLNQVYLNGGESNWYNDDKGNLIFEALDGESAMMLGGRGLGVSTTKLPSGEWEWRTAATGYGLTADLITAGHLNADRIEAGSITVNKLSSTVGRELEIGSNKALSLFATADGSRPAGSLKTTDGYIEIIAGSGSIPAKINVMSGGELNLTGGKVNITSNGTLDVESNGVFTLKSNGANSIDSTADGVYIGSDGVNFGGGKFKVSFNGNTSTVYMNTALVQIGSTSTETLKKKLDDMSDATEAAQETADAKSQTYRCTSSQITGKQYKVGDVWVDTGSTYQWEYICKQVSNPRNASADWMLVSTAITQGAALNVDAVNGTINMIAANTITIAAGATISIAAGKALNLTTAGTVTIGNGGKPFTIGSNGTNAYIYNGRSTVSTTNTDGVYLGTDGINVGKANDGYVIAKADGTVDISGTLRATALYIGGTQAAISLDNSGKISLGSLHSTKLSDYNFDSLGSGTGIIITPTKIQAGSTGDIDFSAAKSLSLKAGAISLTALASTKLSDYNFDSLGSGTGIVITPTKIKAGSTGDIDFSAAKSLSLKAGAISLTALASTKLSDYNFDSLGSGTGIVITPTKIQAGSTGDIDFSAAKSFSVKAGSISLSSLASINLSSYTFDSLGNSSGTGVYITPTLLRAKSTGDVDFSAAKSFSVKAGAISLTSLASTKLSDYNFDSLGSGTGIVITPTKIKAGSTGDIDFSAAKSISLKAGSITMAAISDAPDLSIYAKSADVYGKQSGITITANGIDISGSQYVKIASGGYFQVTTGNFGINSNAGTDDYVMWAGANTAANSFFKVKKNGEVTVTKLMSLNEQGVESEVNLRNYELWKLGYQTIKQSTITTDSSGYCKSFTLSNGTTVNFKHASTVTVSGSWSGKTFTATATSGDSTASIQTVLSIGTGTPGGSVTDTLTPSFGNDHTGMISVKAEMYNVSEQYPIRAKIDASAVYSAGGTLTTNWVILPGGQRYDISSAGGDSASCSVSAGSTIRYDSTNHKYTGNIMALGNNVARHTIPYDSGTQAYEDGETAGRTAGYNSAKWSYTFDTDQVTISKNTTGSSFPTTVGVYPTITYNSTTHEYTAKSFFDDQMTGSVTSTGTQAYSAGFTAGEAQFKSETLHLRGNSVKVTPIDSSTRITYNGYYYYKAGPELTFYYTGGDVIRYYKETT